MLHRSTTGRDLESEELLGLLQNLHGSVEWATRRKRDLAGVADAVLREDCWRERVVEEESIVLVVMSWLWAERPNCIVIRCSDSHFEIESLK